MCGCRRCLDDINIHSILLTGMFAMYMVTNNKTEISLSGVMGEFLLAQIELF